MNINVSDSSTVTDVSSVSFPNFELLYTWLFGDASTLSYWRLEGNSNDSKDSKNGTDTAITYSPANGKFGQGAGFNGTTSKISFTPYSSGGTNLTICAWVKYSTATANASAVYHQNTVGQSLVKLGQQTGSASGKLSFLIRDSVQTSTTEAISSSTYNDGLWHFVVGTKDSSGNVKIYVDGQSAGTGSNTLNTGDVLNSGNTFLFGKNEALFFSGAVDDVAVFNRVLSATEILNHWQGADPFPSVSDSSTVTDFPGNYPDLVIVTEKVTVAVAGISVNDSSTVTENLSLTGRTYLSTSFDSSTVTEAITVSVVDNINVSDLSTVTESLVMGGQDYLSLSDLSAVTEFLTINAIEQPQGLFDSSTVTENSTVQEVMNLSLFDSSAVTESLTVTIFLPISTNDSSTVTETVTVVMSGIVLSTLFDGSTVTETTTLLVVSNLNLFDSSMVVENISPVIVNDISSFDSSTVTETVTLVFSLVVSTNDSSIVTETISLLVPEFENLVDSTTVTESLSFNVVGSLSLTDSTTVTESFVGNLAQNITLSDSSAVTELVNVMAVELANLVDTSTVTDVITSLKFPVEEANLEKIKQDFIYLRANDNLS